MKKNNKKGFTLVELVIVVAVMAVLVAVAIPTIGSITGKATDAVGKSNAKTIESIIKLAEADVDGGKVPAETIATAIYDAKLGITQGTESGAAAPTFYYNPTTGKVVATELPTGATAAEWATITFDTAGKVTCSANPAFGTGSGADKGGTYGPKDDGTVAWTPAT